jgi:signal transduction histidine kinase/ligand-binding sensor domain-containing protein/DNA-binding response OmpR family regulator
MNRGFVLLILLVIALPSGSVGQRVMNYQLYENVLLSPEALSVRCFVQDGQGLMWVGSDKGLFSYDGYAPHAHFAYGDSMNLPVNCALLYGDDRLLLGSQRGVLAYNYKSDAYEDFPWPHRDEVQALTVTGGDLWVGSMTGFFRYDMQTNECEKITLDPDAAGQAMVYSILEDDGYIYVGSNAGFGRYEPAAKRFVHLLPNPGHDRCEAVFVNTLLKDRERGCIWVGTSGALLKYAPSTDTFDYIADFPFIKAMNLDGAGRLLIGTDNGLYLYDGTGVDYVRHDSRDLKSLANNIVWAVYKDSGDNVWLGTDYGISMSPGNRNFEFIPIHQLTNSADGNHVYSIYKDSRGYYWIGGTSGLIRAAGLYQGAASLWYTMSRPDCFIAHNRIRNIFEDSGGNLWVLSDGGVNRYDYASGRFLSCFVTDSSRTWHSSWAYGMLEDLQGNLWIATCMSGILVTGREGLLDRPFSTAGRCFNTTNGLCGNFVSHIVLDGGGNVWALVYKLGLDRINPLTGQVVHVPLGGAKPDLLLCDSEGYIWAAFRGGLVRIDASSLEMQTVSIDGNPLAMIEVEGNIWVSSANGIQIVDSKDLTVQHQNILNHTFTGLYYDTADNRVCLGGIDGLSVARPSLVCTRSDDSPIVITALHAGDLSWSIGSYKGQSIRYLEHLRLHHRQNTFVIEFSDFNYSQEQRSSFIYKLNQGDDAWHVLKANENSITFTNLEPGRRLLQIGRLGVNGQPSDPVKSFEIEILSPWYATAAAKGVYVALLLALALWTLYFFRVRNQLRFERIEKEKTIEQSKLKMDFFTEISHEFKTPLSLIIAFISQLLLETKRPSEEKRKFNLIYQNAMKLSSLIHQALDFYRDDNKTPVGMITSHIEFIEFARALFSTYMERMKDKHVDFIFSTTLNSIYLNVDVVKIESVLSNLLSNACKFTRENDNIMLSIEYTHSDESLEIRVSDTGIGIPAQDLPYVFQRFFQSSAHSLNKEGTGVGLYMTKKFIELHGGSVHVESEEGNGSTFVVRLPPQCLPGGDDSRRELLHNEGGDKPLIVIVEDNTDMAEFICHIFASEYRCVMAHNGKVGLKLATELLPDLIIADVMMPVMDGLEMCRRLKHYVPTSTIPLILLTAKDDKDTELDSIRLNIDAFISKPFDLSILHSRVKQLIASKKQMEKKVRIEILSDPRKVEDHVSFAEKLLASVTRVIEENLSDPDFNVNTLSEIAGISQKQIYRKIKELTGMTTVEYIKSIKMKKAALLLAGKKFTVSEVMYMIGFSNHSYFAKCFKAQFGVHPNMYNNGRYPT